MRGRENGVKDGGVGVRASTLTPAPPNRPVPVWPRPHYNLSGHHKQPDRPHKLQLGAASYALDPLAKVAELRVLTLQKWATSWDDQKTAGLHLRDLVDMGWQCLLCFSDPPPWGGDESGEKWGGVKVNATGDSWGHPQTETEKSKLDLSCRRFDVTRIEDVKAKYDQIVGGDFESIAYMCSVPPEILRESRRAHPGGAVHGWVSLIEGDWTRERVAEHFRGGGEEPTLDRFVALRDMTRLDVMAQPIGENHVFTWLSRIVGCFERRA